MKLTFETDRSSVMTKKELAEKIAKKIGYRFAGGEGDLWNVVDDSEDGEGAHGVIDLSKNTIAWTDGPLEGEEPDEIGDLLQLLGISTLIWCENEDGEEVAYWEL